MLVTVNTRAVMRRNRARGRAGGLIGEADVREEIVNGVDRRGGGGDGGLSGEDSMLGWLMVGGGSGVVEAGGIGVVGKRVGVDVRVGVVLGSAVGIVRIDRRGDRRGRRRRVGRRRRWKVVEGAGVVELRLRVLWGREGVGRVEIRRWRLVRALVWVGDGRRWRRMIWVAVRRVRIRIIHRLLLPLLLPPRSALLLRLLDRFLGPEERGRGDAGLNQFTREEEARGKSVVEKMA